MSPRPTSPKRKPISFKRRFNAWLRRQRGWMIKLGCSLLGLLLLLGAGLYFLPDMIAAKAPPLDRSRDLYTLNRPASFSFLDRDGYPAGERGALVGERLRLKDLPPYLPAAFIAMEDRRFYDHEGFDLKGLIRAAWVNWQAGHVVQGGSTISQQLAKILFNNPERTYKRKYKELMDATSLEQSLSKTEILELYLNRIYLGSGAYGVDGASRVYFGKSARELSLAEAAMLATLTRAPSLFSPRRDLAKAQMRANTVLAAMVETRAISAKDADVARARPARLQAQGIQDSRNYFLDTAADEARRLVGINGQVREDLLVQTTFAPVIQRAAHEALNSQLRKNGKKLRISEGAVVVMQPDGAVAALIGGRSYDSSVFNRATQARRQPGSAFKPFVFLAAIQAGISPWEIREDGPVDIQGWKPENYGKRYFGTVTLIQALTHSINTVTAGLAQEVGVKRVIDAARAVGIQSPLAQNASLALGTSEVTPLELTAAYATFANQGRKAVPFFVTQIEDKRGRVLYRRSTPTPVMVVAEADNADLTAMLHAVVTSGTGHGTQLPGRESAGKTGTTQDYRDAWFVGFTADYAATVWLGNDSAKQTMKGVTGGSVPAAIWKQVMLVAEKNMPVKALVKSEPPQDEYYDWDSPYAGSNAAPGYSRDDRPGHYAEQAPPRREPEAPRRRQSFLDWLFGPSEDESPPPQQGQEYEDRWGERR